MDMKIDKKIFLYLGAAVLFLILAYAFVPQVLGGKIVDQSDISGYVGMSHEMNEWNKANPDDPTAWSNSMFGGMPTTVIAAPGRGDWTQPVYDLLTLGKRPATWLFASMLGAFLLMLSLGISLPVAIGGAIAVTFCAYNLQIIQVGHNTKMQAIAFMPWALAGLISCYRWALSKCGKWLPKTVLAAVLFGFGIALQVKANHQQITYYLAIMVLVYAVAVLVWLLCDAERRKDLGRFFAASACLLVFGLAGIATNANKLIPIYKYTPHSMRGGSELVSEKSGDGGEGLSLDYATAWSYGWEELPNMMIPNFNGGSSAAAVNPEKSATIEILRQAGQSNLKEVAKNLPMYWGPQPFTAGPMYMGAITVFLFILGLMFCEGKEKWWVVACTVLFILLSLGSHFMGFTKFWYDHIPFYNKFRTVSMGLVALQVTLPVLGFMALDSVVRNAEVAERFKKKGWIALAITAGFCALVFLIPSLAGNFFSQSDASQPEVLITAFMKDRVMLLRNDALRSMLLILAAFGLIYWGTMIPSSAKESFRTHPEMGEKRRRTASILVCLLVLLDLFPVAKRYLNSDDFVTPKNFNSQFDKRPVDEMILNDEDPSYRVLDLSVNVFNDSHPSYWHKNIGGYSPAKLQRYQDLIDRHLTAECNAIYSEIAEATTIQEAFEMIGYHPALSMLNTRYIILGADNAPLVYPYGLGNAWFVNSLRRPADKNEEIDLLDDVDLETTAIIADDFAWAQDKLKATPADTTASIELTYYAPNELRYSYSSEKESAAIFSEVYYPEGWHLWLADGGIRGEEIPLFRADWLLRGAFLPAGNHELVMRFEPESYVTSARISRCGSILLILALLGSAAAAFMTARKKEE